MPLCLSPLDPPQCIRIFATSAWRRSATPSSTGSALHSGTTCMASAWRAWRRRWSPRQWWRWWQPTRWSLSPQSYRYGAHTVDVYWHAWKYWHLGKTSARKYCLCSLWSSLLEQTRAENHRHFAYLELYNIVSLSNLSDRFINHTKNY